MFYPSSSVEPIGLAIIRAFSWGAATANTGRFASGVNFGEDHAKIELRRLTFLNERDSRS